MFFKILYGQGDFFLFEFNFSSLLFEKEVLQVFPTFVRFVKNQSTNYRFVTAYDSLKKNYFLNKNLPALVRNFTRFLRGISPPCISKNCTRLSNNLTYVTYGCRSKPARHAASPYQQKDTLIFREKLKR